MAVSIPMVPGGYVYTAAGRICGRWARDPDGTSWADKGQLDPAVHLWRARNAWGTDVAIIDRLRPEDGVRFHLADGTEYRATRSRIERYGFTQDFGHGAQWFLPDEKWERQRALLPVAPPPAAPAPAPPPEVPLATREQWVTPALAQEWLAAFAYPRQRTYRPHRARTLAALMARGEFQATPIWFGVLEGQRYLVDGQHRLHAIALSGQAYMLPVIEQAVSTEDALDALYSRLDRGMTRSFGDIYEAHALSTELGLNREQVRRLGNAVPHLLNGFQQRNAAYSLATSGDARVAAVREYGEAARRLYAVWASGPSLPVRRVEIGPVLAVALVTARYQPERAARFWRGVVWREHLAAGAPEATLAQWLEAHAIRYGNRERDTQTFPPAYFARAAAGAWNAAYRGTSYRMVIVRDHNAPIRIAGTPYTGKPGEDEGGA